MDFIEIPTTSSAHRQIMYLPVSPNGKAFPAQLELRYLRAPDRWFLSVSDAATGELYVNHIPLVCSYVVLNDLFFPFRYLFRGSGLGSFFCLKGVDTPTTSDPASGTLSQFRLFWGDTFRGSSVKE